MNIKRTGFDFEEVIDLDLVERVSNNSSTVSYKDLEQVAADAGFIKRLPKTKKNRRKGLPIQNNLESKFDH